MSRKKTPKSKAGSAPATSALPAANGPRPVRPGTARPGPEAPPNGPPQPGRSSIGGGGDFYDVAFKVSRAPPAPGDASAAGGVRPELSGEGVRGKGAGPCGASARSWLPEQHPAAGKAGAVHRALTHTHTQLSNPGLGYPTYGKAALSPSATHTRRAGPDKGSCGSQSLAGIFSLFPDAPAPTKGSSLIFPYVAFSGPQGLPVSF